MPLFLPLINTATLKHSTSTGNLKREGRKNRRKSCAAFSGKAGTTPTPMQWSAAPNGGFTTGTPWISPNPNYRTVNVRQALADPDSILHYYQRLIALRKQTPCLIYGSFLLLKQKNPRLFCYLRKLEQERILVLLNLGGGTEPCPLPDGFTAQSLLIGNYGDAAKGLPEALRPWEACVYRLR